MYVHFAIIPSFPLDELDELDEFHPDARDELGLDAVVALVVLFDDEVVIVGFLATTGLGT